MKKSVALAVLAGIWISAVLVGPAQADPTNTYIVNDTFGYASTGTEIENSLDCDSGDVASGGGFRLTSSNPNIRLMSSRPQLDRSGWTVGIINNAGSSTDVEIYVVCES